MELEGLLKPFNHKYQCIGFRAGGWRIQPSEDIIKAMRNVGIISDTSVFVGGLSGKNGDIFDFRKAPIDKPTWWTSAKDVCEIGDISGGGILEIPIYAESGDIFDFISISRIRSLLTYIYKDIFPARAKIDQTAANLRSQKSSRTLSDYSINIYDTMILRKRIPLKFDFTKLSAYKMIDMLNKIQYNSSENKPIILIGHTKDPYSPKALHDFLNYTLHLKEAGKLHFATYQEAVCNQVSKRD